MKFLETSLNPVTKYWPAIVGAIFAVFVLVAPSGLAGLTVRARGLVHRRAVAPS